MKGLLNVIDTWDKTNEAESADIILCTNMNEKNHSIGETVQKIDQLIIVLRDISQDLNEILMALKTLKAASHVPHHESLEASASIATEPELETIEEVAALFPKELEEMLFFEEQETFIVIKPRRFLGSETFAKIASIVRGVGGEYVSAGRDSHFKIFKRAR